MKMLPLRNSAKTSLILQRLDYPVFFGARVDLQVSEGGNLANVGFGMEAVQSRTHGWYAQSFQQARGVSKAWSHASSYIVRATRDVVSWGIMHAWLLGSAWWCIARVLLVC